MSSEDRGATGGSQQCTDRIARRSSPRARFGGRAFTLIELITVVALIGIIGVAIAGPTLTNLSSVRRRGAANRIASDIRYAQRWAMATRLRTWVNFTVASNRYDLYVESSTAPGKANRVALVHPLSNATGSVNVGASPFTGATLSSVSIAGTSELEFDSLGCPYDGNSSVLSADGQIQLGGGVTITVSAVSGLAVVSG